MVHIIGLKEDANMSIKQNGRENAVKSYQQAIEILNGKTSRKLANNTYLQRRDDKTIAVKLHDTDVVTYTTDEKIILNSGGWRTVTTKERINTFSPLTVYQNKSIWYVG